MTSRPLSFPPRSSPNFTARALGKCVYVLLCGLSLPISTAPAFSEELNHDEMVCALDPQCSMPFSDRRVRGITTTVSARTPGTFDRTINFAFDSAELTAQARSELDKVAGALKDPSVAKYPIIIGGHTDAAGTMDYNQRLSERRAQSVRQYLIAQHGIDASRLSTKGYGKSKLLLPDDPTNELNRRVEFQNPKYSTAAAGTAPAPSISSPVPVLQSPQSPGPPTPQGNGL